MEQTSKNKQMLLRSRFGKIIGHNVWCYEQVCVAPAANLLIARVSSWRDYLAENLILNTKEKSIKNERWQKWF